MSIILTSNIEEVSERIRLRLNDLVDSDKVLNRATVTTLALMKARIQNRGEKSDNTQIGKYSGSEKKKFSPSITSIGSKKRKKETDKITKITKRNKKSVSFIGGYAAFRQSQGKQIDYIDFTLSGDMMRSFQVIPISKTEIGIGFTNEKQAKKAEYLEERFGAVFQNSNEEIREFLENVQEDVKKILS